MVHRLIAAKWAEERLKPRVLEGTFTDEELKDLNQLGYNCYFLPNFPSNYEGPVVSAETKKQIYVDGKDIDAFSYCFIDIDMKDYLNENQDRRHEYATKEEFLEVLNQFTLKPSTIIDSGNGIHAYWRIVDLDAMSYLRLQRRLARYFKTDPAVSSIYQLMRLPGTFNVKDPDNYKECAIIGGDDGEYTCEQLDQTLPKITMKDEEYCKQHYDKTYHFDQTKIAVSEELPQKFLILMKNNEEMRRLFYGPVPDRSIADYRLAHLLLAQGLTKEEAMSVLINTAKAIERAPIHRYNYALNIVEKIFIAIEDPDSDLLSSSVKDILRATDSEEGMRFPCSEVVDATEKGFRLSEVLGLIGAPGNGKTTLGLNFFVWFAERNPEYIHLFVSLEQPKREIAQRWQTMTKGMGAFVEDKVHILDNYNKDKSYRNLSLSDIQAYILKLEEKTGNKVGCVVIDHVGILKHENYKDKSGLPAVFAQLKSVAVSTNTFLVVQSQTSRDKADYGDVELDQNAAYGGAQFEWFCDYIMTTWQPLKRVYDIAPHMTVNAFKFAKIRGKKPLADKIKENQVYTLMFDPTNERLEQMNNEQMVEYEFFLDQAVKRRKQDRKETPSKAAMITWIKPKEPNEHRESDSN